MKKTVAVILLICFSAAVCPLFSLTLDNYEPYSKAEFPKWSLELRRAECIFFGGIPITFPVTALAAGIAKADLSFGQTLVIAASLSAVIAIIDYIIGVVRDAD